MGGSYSDTVSNQTRLRQYPGRHTCELGRMTRTSVLDTRWVWSARVRLVSWLFIHDTR